MILPPIPRVHWQCLDTFFIVMIWGQGERRHLLLASSRQRLKMLLNTLYCTGQPPRAQRCLAPKVSSVAAEKPLYSATAGIPTVWYWHNAGWTHVNGTTQRSQEQTHTHIVNQFLTKVQIMSMEKGQSFIKCCFKNRTYIRKKMYIDPHFILYSKINGSQTVNVKP